MRFTIPGEPVGKARPRFARTPSGNVKAYTPAKTAGYERYVAMLYRASGGKLNDGAVMINITAYYKMPQKLSKARFSDMLNGVLLPTKKPDIDNVVKIILDALNSVAYTDDSHIVRLSAEKSYAINPSVEVEIDEI